MLAVRRLSDGVEIISTVMFIVVMVVMVLSVIMRSATVPLIWGEEISLTLFLWVTLLGSSCVLRDRDHARMEIIYDVLNVPARRIMCGVVSLALGAVLWLSIWPMLDLSIFMRRMVLPVSELSMTFVYISIPVFILVVALRMLFHALQAFWATGEFGSLSQN